jgi:hypothetical protein
VPSAHPFTLFALTIVSAALAFPAFAQAPPMAPAPAPTRPVGSGTNPQQVASEADHQDMMNQLGISTIRRGADGSPTGQNPANYDESKANPFPQPS